MADEVNSGGNPATPAPANTESGTQENTQGTTQTQTPETEKQFTISRDEWLDKRREDRNKLKALEDQVRSLVDALKPEKKTEPVPVAADGAMAEVTKLRSELSFKQALLDSGASLSPVQRNKMYKLYTLENPEDADVWVAENLEALGLKKSPTPAPAPLPAKPTPAPTPGARSDAGPPMTTYPATAQLATVTRFQDIDPVVFAQLSREERMKITGRIMNGGNKANPYVRQGKK